ncbi:MAG: macro domain-containing protein [Planctomycetota bacterium]|jgi:O-acetyl-ADP-ribose deacetylase (regulator of RNase III)
MVDVHVVMGDVTTLDVDAIVNSANNDLILGAGVSGAIRRVGGASIQEECNRIGTIPLGEAAVTTAGDLPCGWIIHAAVFPLGMWADDASMRDGVRSSLRIAEKRRFKSLGIPAIGAGAGAFPIDRCAVVLMEEIAEHIKRETCLDVILFVLLDEKNLTIFKEHFQKHFPDRDAEAKPLHVPRIETPEEKKSPDPEAGPGLD